MSEPATGVPASGSTSGIPCSESEGSDGLSSATSNSVKETQKGKYDPINKKTLLGLLL
ncbi:hypothetical protein GCM10010301_73600 [Streptomyces plicatus]|nr:hypothetical protein GCM10010301_73600 [Streptomyces plicatus]